MKRNQMIDHEKSSGNVFADLGFPHSEDEIVKAKLTVEIFRHIKERRLTQTAAAKLLGTTQAQVSAIMRCRPVNISIGRLIQFLNILGQDIELTVRPALSKDSRRPGHISVTVQAGV